MKASILIVTPEPGFGELVQQGLDDSGSFKVQIAHGIADLTVNAEKEAPTLALLDMGFGEKDLLEIGRSLRGMNPDLDLVILADDELPPAMDALRPWVLLRKPFHLPDFFQLVRTLPAVPGKEKELAEEHKLAGEDNKMENKPSDHETPEIPWLKDVSKAAQHLTRLTLESSAQAALMTRKKKLWAYAGQLSQNAANELADTVSRHWDGQKGNDLLRFVRLSSTRAEHMLYATCMTADVILALVFDAETPFSTIRNQANNLAQALAIAKTGPVEAGEREPGLEGEQLQVESETFEFDDDDGELEIPSIADILAEIPPPVPENQPDIEIPAMDVNGFGNLISEPDRDLSAVVTRPSTPQPRSRSSIEPSPAIPMGDLDVIDSAGNRDGSLENMVEELAATLPSESQRRQSGNPLRQPASGELDATRPNLSTDIAGRADFHPASAGMVQLNFACLLVPRFTAHYLTGDLADSLSEWMPDIAVAFGWRLEFLAVRPEYLQWVVNVPPNTSPGYLMRITRQQTSQKIFEDIPRLKHENPSGDFWAPGYLIMGGIQPHPPQLVKDYIRQTRQRQGISQPRR